MCHLTFGVKSSPYIATQVLQQAASEYAQKYPAAARCIFQDFYADDFLTGASTLSAARELQRQLCALFEEIGMLLRKWRSNSPAFVRVTPEELRDVSSKEVVISNDPTAHGKALGIHWDTQTDELHVVTPEILPDIPMKRTVASTAAKTYDNIGWFGPVTLTVKLLMQALWQAGTI